MTWKIFNTKTKQIDDSGLTIDQAVRMCKLYKYYIFLPE